MDSEKAGEIGDVPSNDLEKVQHDPNIKTEEPFSEVSERKLLFKIDCWVMPTLSFLFFLNFLDKSNIGNARIFNLSQDLHLKNNEYNNALVIYFVAYVVFDIPFTLIMRSIQPHIWLSVCTFAFGIVTMCQGFAQSYGGLLAARFFLGIAEAGTFSCCFYVLGMWYKRAEAQKRFTFFYSSIQLAGAFTGLLASAIGLLDGHRGYSGWRWIFIIEGAITAAVGIPLFFLLPDFPAQTKWLSATEKKFILARLAEDRGNEDATKDHLTLGVVLRILREPKILLGGLLYFSFVVPGYGYAYFVPTIIHQYTKSAIRTQLLSVPPWAAGFTTSLVLAYLSDRIRHRFLFIVCPLCVAVVGYAILLAIHDNSHAQYAALFLILSGIFAALPISVCWYSMNIVGHTRRGVGLGWQIGFGNAGGIVAVYLFLQDQAPFYTQGYGTSLAFVLLAMILSTAYLYTCWRENKAKDRLVSQGDGGEDGADSEVIDDLSPAFRNML